MSEPVTAFISERDGSDFAVRIVTGRHSLTGDEPAASGGADIGPNPYQLLVAALGECTAMTVRWFARQKGWPLDHVSVTVTHRKGEVEGRPGSTDIFDKIVLIEGEQLSEEQRARLLDVAAKCPVHRTLESQPVIATVAGTVQPPESPLTR